MHAEIVNIRGFSAHADSEQMISWLSAAPEPRTVFVVHGESSSAAALAQTLRDRIGWNAVVPRHLESVRID